MAVKRDVEHVAPPSVDRFSLRSGGQWLPGVLLEAGVSPRSSWKFWGLGEGPWWVHGRPVLGPLCADRWDSVLEMAGAAGLASCDQVSKPEVTWRGLRDRCRAPRRGLAGGAAVGTLWEAL